MKKNEGGPVQPNPLDIPFEDDGRKKDYVYGITRRDWLAGLAMQGMMANPEIIDSEIAPRMAQGEGSAENITKTSYRIADAMIAEGDKD